MSLAQRLLSGCVAAMCCHHALAFEQDNDLTPGERRVFDDCLVDFEASLEWLNRASVVFEVVNSSNHPDWTDRRSRWIVRFKRDGDRMEWRSRVQQLAGDGYTVVRDPAAFPDAWSFSDGRAIYLTWTIAEQPRIQSARFTEEVDAFRKAQLEGVVSGAPIFGLVYGSSGRTIPELLAEASAKSVQIESVGDHAVVRLRGKGQHGEVLVEMRSDAPHPLIGWRVERDRDDYADEQKLIEGGLGAWRAEFEVMDWQLVEGQWVPRTARLVIQRTYLDGWTQIDTYDYRVNEVDLDPDVSDPTSFHAGLIEGTPMRRFDANGDPGGVQYEYRNGDIRVFVPHDDLAWLTTLAEFTQKGEPEAIAPGPPVSAGHPYCGAYSLYVCGLLLDRPFDPSALFDEKVVTSVFGSSLGDLEAAANDHGLAAKAVERLDVSRLRALRGPTILPVRSTPASPQADHFLVFIRDVEEQALCIDPAEGLVSLDYGDLSARWQGTALLFGDDRRVSVLGPSAVLTASALVMGAALGLVARRRRKAMPCAPSGMRTWCMQVGVVLAAAVGLASVAHWISPAGFLRDAAGVTFVRLRVASAWNIDSISDHDFIAAAKRGEALVIDARYPRDYRAGHVAGAINLPVTASDRGIQEAMRSVPANRSIIVYCESAECEFDRMLAARLVALGYERVAVTTSGWSELFEELPAGVTATAEATEP
jgi:rhodanese-related sulfurtransferase